MPSPEERWHSARFVRFESLYKPKRCFRCLSKERKKEGTKRIDVRQVGQQPTVPQAALGPSLLGKTATIAKEDKSADEAQSRFECGVQAFWFVLKAGQAQETIPK